MPRPAPRPLEPAKSGLHCLSFWGCLPHQQMSPLRLGLCPAHRAVVAVSQASRGSCHPPCWSAIPSPEGNTSHSSSSCHKRHYQHLPGHSQLLRNNLPRWALLSPAQVSDCLCCAGLSRTLRLDLRSPQEVDVSFAVGATTSHSGSHSCWKRAAS